MKWLIDKVLPGLVGAFLGGLVVWVAIGIDAVSGRLVEQLAQNWLPESAIIFTGRRGDCPAGWTEIARGRLMADARETDVFERFVETDTREGAELLHGWLQIYPTICARGGLAE